MVKGCMGLFGLGWGGELWGRGWWCIWRIFGIRAMKYKPLLVLRRKSIIICLVVIVQYCLLPFYTPVGAFLGWSISWYVSRSDDMANDNHVKF